MSEATGQMERLFKMIDIHTHILPGVDDGATTLDESIRMIQQAVGSGISVICATPHILDGVSSSLVEQINRSFQLLQSQLVERKIPVKLVLGSEIYIRHDIESLRRFNFFSFNQTDKYILMELPLGGLPSGVDRLIRKLKKEGLTVIIAHPERCFIQKDPLPQIENMVNMGALLQVNAGSILGHFGTPVRKTAESMMEQSLAHFMASDAHNLSSSSPKALSQAFERVSSLVGRSRAEELVIHNPSKILEEDKSSAYEEELNMESKQSLLLTSLSSNYKQT